MSDTARIGSLVSWSLMDSVWHGAYLVGAIAVMFSINAKLALLVVSVIPILALLFSFFNRRLTKLNHEVREINSRITGNFNEGITGAKTVKSLTIEKRSLIISGRIPRFTKRNPFMPRPSAASFRPPCILLLPLRWRWSFGAADTWPPMKWAPSPSLFPTRRA